jgi:hypothetical protein
MLIDSLKVFDLVRVTTNGGPGESTLVLSLLLYKRVFFADDVGYGDINASATISALCCRRRARSSSGVPVRPLGLHANTVRITAPGAGICTLTVSGARTRGGLRATLEPVVRVGEDPRLGRARRAAPT